MEEEERILNIPLRMAKNAPRSIRARRAITEIREHVMRHLKADEENVWIDGALNERIWSRGIQKPPSKIRVKAIKFEDGLVEISLADE